MFVPSIGTTFHANILVPVDYVHKDTNQPLFATQGSLTFDISISSYIITPYYFLFSLFYYTVYLKAGTPPPVEGCQ